jgi:hypothetical protein
MVRECLGAVGRLVDVVVDPQRAGDRSPDGRVVVNHENASSHAGIVACPA